MRRPDKFVGVKAIQLLPIAYLADVHGFIYFVPYMLFVLAIAQVLAFSRRRAGKVTRNANGGASGIAPDHADDAALALAN
jgi:hypothetical protein